MKKINNIKIVSTGKYLPKKVVSNTDLEKIVETSDEWIFSRTGIKNRRYVEEESVNDMAYLSAVDAINKVNYDVNNIDLIIVATCSSVRRVPSVASLVQAKLGLNHKAITCFDINAACTGFIYALDIAAQLLNNSTFKGALIIGSETLTKFTDFTDRNTCVLFGDGAGAMLIENTNMMKPAYFFNASTGDFEDTLVCDDYIKMDGRKVYSFATKAITSAVLKVLSDLEINMEDVEKIIPHQANQRIIETASKNLNVDLNKFFINIENYGNTSAASVIIAIDEYLAESEKLEDKKIVVVGFGGGFTWGACLLTL
ncbi:MAG: beta-ketoacyl-ACP synthase III [Bacilli bacterium]